MTHSIYRQEGLGVRLPYNCLIWNRFKVLAKHRGQDDAAEGGGRFPRSSRLCV
jgi:hypothetical protein